VLKINEEVICRLLVLLSAQYEEVTRMVYNKEEINVMTIPLVQGTPLLNLISKLAKFEKDIPNINNIKDLIEKVSDNKWIHMD